VLDGLRGETSIAELCRREGIAESMYYSWSKEFLEAGKRRLAGDTARAATTDEVE
jgi:transposase